MRRGDVSLLVFADYSKAFPNVQFSTVVKKKKHNMGFSKEFLKWTTNYLSNRHHLVQTDDQRSEKESAVFCVSLGSILGPFLFNLYVAHLQAHLPILVFPARGRHHTICNLQSTISEMNDVMKRLGLCSNNCHLSLIYVRSDEIKAMSSGFSGGKQLIITANTSNRGGVCLF